MSRTLVVAISAILLLETTVLHLWIAPRAPVVAWLLTLTSVLTLVWLWRDDARYRAGSVQADDERIDLQLGARWRGTVARSQLASAMRPTFRDLPESGTPAAADFVNLMKPADPNVLLTLHAPVPLRAFGLVTKNVRRIALHLDAPDEFLSLVSPR